MTADTTLTAEQIRALLEDVRWTHAKCESLGWAQASGLISVSMTPDQYAAQREMHAAETRLELAAPALARTALVALEENANLRAMLRVELTRPGGENHVTD